MILVYSNDLFFHSKFSISFTKKVFLFALSKIEPTCPITQCKVYIYYQIIKFLGKLLCFFVVTCFKCVIFDGQNITTYNFLNQCATTTVINYH